MKIVCFDGKDQCGKTWTLTKIKNILGEGKHYSYVNFPSKALCSTDIFYKLTLPENKNSIDMKFEFIDLLLKEESDYIETELKKKTAILWVDRMLFSSLVYQGNQDDWTLEEEIMRRYKKMFKKIGISGDNFYNFIFINKIKDHEDETNEAKKNFDKMGDVIGRKFDNLLYKVIDSKEFYNDFLKNVHVFNESFFVNNKPPYTREDLNKLDDERISIIFKTVGLIK